MYYAISDVNFVFNISINSSNFVEKSLQFANFLFRKELVPSCVVTPFSSELGYLFSTFSFPSVLLTMYEWTILSLGIVSVLILAVILEPTINFCFLWKFEGIILVFNWVPAVGVFLA